MTQIIGTTPETIQALIAERDHWKRLAHDRVVSANALLDRARKAEALSNLFSEHLERRTLTLELVQALADRYEKALREIADDPYQFGQRVQRMKNIARRALPSSQEPKE